MNSLADAMFNILTNILISLSYRDFMQTTSQNEL